MTDRAALADKVAEIDALYKKATKGKLYVNPHSGHPAFSRVESEEYGFQCRIADASLFVSLVNAWPTIAAALRDGGWISVGERLPVASEDVLVRHKDGCVFQGYHISGTWRVCVSQCKAHVVYADGAITHWQPLPAAPSREGK